MNTIKSIILICSFIAVVNSFGINPRRVAQKKCLNCHTIGKQGGKGPDLANLEERHDIVWVKNFFATDKDQESHNAAKYAGKDFEDLFEYIYAISAGSNADIADGVGNKKAGRLLSSSCTSCHGPAGYARNPETPHLRGQNAKYLINQLKAFREGARVDKDGVMSNVAKSLSDRDIVNISVYYEQLNN